MNRSPSLIPSVLSCALIASLSLLNIGSAWSAPQPQESAKTTANKQTKLIKPKVGKAKANKYKSARAKAKKSTLAGKAAPLKLQASKEIPAPIVASAGKVTTNPYFVNQPVAILPLAAQSEGAHPVIAKTTPIQAAPAVVAVAATAPASSQQARVSPQPESVAAATPSRTVTASAATSATLVESTLAAPQNTAVAAAASLIPPIYGQAVANPVANSDIAAYQPLNASASGNKNPYLANQSQPFVLPDLFKLFSLFGSGLKIASPFPAQTNTTPTAPAYIPPAYSAPAYSSAPVFSLPTFALPTYKAPAYGATSYGSSGYAAPIPVPATNVATQSQPASATNAISSLFSSLKMMIPLTGDATILPTIKKVYPTGEKPLVVLNFKCPTEVLGITPPPMKLLHEAVNFGFNGLNKTNLLSFNLQQVCS